MEVSELSIVIRVRNAGYTEVGNRFWELGTAEEDTQTRAVLGGVISIDVIVRRYLK